MIEMVQKYMRGDATRRETYIDLGAVVYEFKHCERINQLESLGINTKSIMHIRANFIMNLMHYV